MRHSTPFKLICLNALAIFLFSACNQVPPHLSAIPSEASMCVAFDMQSMGSKGHLDHLDEFQLTGMLEQELASENKALAAKLEELKSNPFALGVDPLASLYLFAVNQPDGNRFIGLNGKLVDHGAFSALVEEVMTAADPNMQIKDEGTYKSVTWDDGRTILGWDKSKFSMLWAGDGSSSANLQANLDMVLKHASEQPLTSDPQFREFISAAKDISFWMDLRVLEEDPEYKRTVGSLGEGIAGSRMMGHLDFQDGKIVIDGQIKYNEKAEKMLAGKTVQRDGGIAKEVLAKMPGKDIVAVGGFAFLPEELGKILQEQINSSAQLDLINRQMALTSGMNLTDVMASFGGDLVFVANGTSDPADSTSKGMSMVLSMKNKQLHDQVFAFLPPPLAQPMPGGYHKISALGELGIYSHMPEDNNWMITTQETVVAGELPGGTSLADSELGQKLADNPVYFFMDMNEEMYPKDVVDDLAREQGLNSGLFYSAMRAFKSLEVTSEGPKTVNAQINLHETGENSLLILLKEVDKQVPQQRAAI